MAARRNRHNPCVLSPEWLERCSSFAWLVFAAPPQREHIKRPEEPAGGLVKTFVLPLDMLEPQNRKQNRPKWWLAERHQAIKQALGYQTRFRDHRHIAPLDGRPTVLCTRFSSVEPDKYNDGFKWAVDALCVPSGRRTWGLGYLRDDRPKDAEIVQWWEPAPQGGGFGLIRVFSDASEGQRSA